MTKKELITSLQKIIKPYVQDQEAFKNLSEETDFINDLKISNYEFVERFNVWEGGGGNSTPETVAQNDIGKRLTCF